MSKNFCFQTEFMNVLISTIKKSNLNYAYNLDLHSKYNVNYICNIIVHLSQKNGNAFKLPYELGKYFNVSNKISRSFLKSLLNDQIDDKFNDAFIKTYIVVGHNISIPIDNLTVIC